MDKKHDEEDHDDVYELMEDLNEYISEKDLLDLTYYIWLRTMIKRKNKEKLLSLFFYYFIRMNHCF